MKREIFTGLLIGLLALTGCTEKDNNNSNGGGDVTVSGNVIDGYIRNALVCIDVNNNNECDEDTFGKTNDDGSYALALPAGTDLTDATVLASGGVDTATGRPFAAIMKAPMPGNTGEKVYVTPVSTVVAARVAGGETLETAKTNVAATLGVDSDKILGDLLESKDPKLVQAALQIQKTIEILKEAEKLSEADDANATDRVAKLLAKAFDGTTEIDGTTTTFSSVINNAVSNDTETLQNKAKVENVKAAAGKVADKVKVLMDNAGTTLDDDLINTVSSVTDLMKEEIVDIIENTTDLTAGAIDDSVLDSTYDNSLLDPTATGGSGDLTIPEIARVARMLAMIGYDYTFTGADDELYTTFRSIGAKATLEDIEAAITAATTYGTVYTEAVRTAMLAAIEQTQGLIEAGDAGGFTQSLIAGKTLYVVTVSDAGLVERYNTWTIDSAVTTIVGYSVYDDDEWSGPFSLLSDGRLQIGDEDPAYVSFISEETDYIKASLTYENQTLRIYFDQAKAEAFIAANILTPSTATITVDGATSDWSGIGAMITDTAGDGTDLEGGDIVSIKAATDGTYVYLLAEFNGDLSTYIAQDNHYFWFGFQQDAELGFGSSGAFLGFYDTQTYVSLSDFGGDYEISGNYLEVKLPLSGIISQLESNVIVIDGITGIGDTEIDHDHTNSIILNIASSKDNPTRLTVGGSAVAGLAVGDVNAYYVFSVTEGKTYTVTVTPSTATDDPDMLVFATSSQMTSYWSSVDSLYGGDEDLAGGIRVGKSDNSPGTVDSVTFTATTTGSHYIMVNGPSDEDEVDTTADYSIKVTTLITATSTGTATLAEFVSTLNTLFDHDGTTPTDAEKAQLLALFETGFVDEGYTASDTEFYQYYAAGKDKNITLEISGSAVDINPAGFSGDYERVVSQPINVYVNGVLDHADNFEYLGYDGSKWFIAGDGAWTETDIIASAYYWPSSGQKMQLMNFFIDDESGYAAANGVKSVIITGPGLPSSGKIMDMTVEATYLDTQVQLTDTEIAAMPETDLEYTIKYYAESASTVSLANTALATTSEIVPARPPLSTETTVASYPSVVVSGSTVTLTPPSGHSFEYAEIFWSDGSSTNLGDTDEDFEESTETYIYTDSQSRTVNNVNCNTSDNLDRSFANLWQAP